MPPRIRPRERLLRAALDYPEAWEDSPWGEQVVKVGKKIFAFLGEPGAPEERIALKLPLSNDLARTFAGVEPVGYGLGKAGWLNVPLLGRGAPPVDLVLDWLDESYRAVALKRLVKLLDERHRAGPP